MLLPPRITSQIDPTSHIEHEPMDLDTNKLPEAYIIKSKECTPELDKTTVVIHYELLTYY